MNIKVVDVLEKINIFGKIEPEVLSRGGIQATVH
jgi:hypothetical protein